MLAMLHIVRRPTGAAFATEHRCSLIRELLMARYEKQLVSKKELRTVCGIPYSPQHIARLEQAGHFPRRIRLGQNRVVWLLSEVEEWLDKRIAQRELQGINPASF